MDSRHILIVVGVFAAMAALAAIAFLLPLSKVIPPQPVLPIPLEAPIPPTAAPDEPAPTQEDAEAAVEPLPIEVPGAIAGRVHVIDAHYWKAFAKKYAALDASDPDWRSKRSDINYTGRPAPDVAVRATNDQCVYEGVTDSKGEYGLHRLPPGEYRVEILSPLPPAWGFSRTFDATIRPGATFDASIVSLDDSALTVNGRVVDVAGNVIPDAFIGIEYVRSYSRQWFDPIGQTVTDESGHFRAANLPSARFEDRVLVASLQTGYFRLTARAKGYAASLIRVPSIGTAQYAALAALFSEEEHAQREQLQQTIPRGLEGNSIADIEIVLHRPARLDGRLIDTNGAAVPNRTIVARPQTYLREFNQSSPDPSLVRLQSDEEGFFSLTAPPGEYGFSVAANDGLHRYWQIDAPLLSVSANEHVRDVLLTIPAPESLGAITGRVIFDATGETVPTVRIEVRRMGDANGAARNGFVQYDRTEGRYAIDGISPGVVRVAFGDNGLSGRLVADIAVESGKTTEFEARLRTPAEIHLQVLRDGQPCGEASPGIFSPSDVGTSFLKIARMQFEHGHLIQGLPEYVVRVFADLQDATGGGFRRAYGDVQTRYGHISELTLDVGGSAGLQGRVRNAPPNAKLGIYVLEGGPSGEVFEREPAPNRSIHIAAYAPATGSNHGFMTMPIPPGSYLFSARCELEDGSVVWRHVTLHIEDATWRDFEFDFAMP